MEKEINYTDENFLPTLEKQKEFILENTNFEYIANVLQMPVKENKTPWIVKYSNKTSTIPDVNHLISTAEHLLTTAIQAPGSIYISKFGPFRIIKAYNRLILDFCIYTMSYD
jgi:hypothetical protein